MTTNVPEDFLVMYESWFNKLSYNVQNVVKDTPPIWGKWQPARQVRLFTVSLWIFPFDR
jgi:hypothetical protein